MTWTPERAGKDLRMVHDPNSWPIWPILPLKRSPNRPPSEGFLYGDPSSDGECIVYVGNMFQAYAATSLKGWRTLKYSDTMEMLNDGWMVD